MPMRANCRHYYCIKEYNLFPKNGYIA
jgi:hypothetical protein